jgi:hypothetical protein
MRLVSTIGSLPRFGRLPYPKSMRAIAIDGVIGPARALKATSGLFRANEHLGKVVLKVLKAWAVGRD